MSGEEEIRAAVRDLTAALVAVSHRLDQPYPDDPEWTPWTRFVSPRLQKLRLLVGLDYRFSHDRRS